MKLILNRFFILCKRSLKQPVNLAMLLTLVLLTVIYRQIPSSEKSLYIPVAVLCEDTDPDMQAAAEELINKNSIFHFYRVGSREEMYQDIMQKKANSGFLIPDGFGRGASQPNPEVKIIVYTSPSSLLPSLCKDEFFNLIFRRMAIRDMKDKAAEASLYSGFDLTELMKQLDAAYDHFQNSTEIFRVEDASGGVYNDLTKEEKADIPIRKFAGLFIFAAGMIGIATYLKDTDERLYTRLRLSERWYMRFLHIISAILPMTIISYPVILITEGGNALALLGTVLLYAVVCVFYSLTLCLVIRRSSVYQKVLPVILTMSIIMGGVIFDVTQFEKALKVLSMLFPPYYF